MTQVDVYAESAPLFSMYLSSRRASRSACTASRSWIQAGRTMIENIPFECHRESEAR